MSDEKHKGVVGPRPWVLNVRFGTIDDNDRTDIVQMIDATGEEDMRANGKHIVRCVNAYEPMREALEVAAAAFESYAKHHAEKADAQQAVFDRDNDPSGSASPLARSLRDQSRRKAEVNAALAAHMRAALLAKKERA